MQGNKFFFTVGPSTAHPDLALWLQEFMDRGLSAESHRGPIFQSMYQSMTEGLMQLMSIPESHAILISDSGSTLMERCIENSVEKYSYHFVSGAFAQKMFNFSQGLGKAARKTEVEWGQHFSEIPKDISGETELICVTHCETSTGIVQDLEWIYALKRSYPDIPICLDMVTTAPMITIDWTKIDMAFFSGQKAFGLPSGIGIWIINKNLAEKLASKNLYAAQQSISDYMRYYPLYQTPSCPNVLGVFLLDKACQNFNEIGLENLNKKVKQYNAIIQKALENSTRLSYNPSPSSSDMILCCELRQAKDTFIHEMQECDLELSEGYGKMKDKQMRIGIFPSTTEKSVEVLKKFLH